MLKQSSNIPRSNAAGFSLIELAIVMVIIGVLLSGIFISLDSTVENARRSNTRTLISEVTEALYGYAQVNGRLPCPSTVASSGYEDPLAGGICTTWHGFVPSASLGISGQVNNDGLLLDSWGNPLRYSVAATNLLNGGFTSLTDMQLLFNTPPVSSYPPLLTVCDNSDCSNIILTNTAPAIVISMGKNWTAFSSTAELANASGDFDGTYTLTNTNNFVNTDYADDNYDDLMEWISPQLLFTRMIQAGALP